MNTHITRLVPWGRSIARVDAIRELHSHSKEVAIYHASQAMGEIALSRLFYKYAVDNGCATCKNPQESWMVLEFWTYDQHVGETTYNLVATRLEAWIAHPTSSLLDELTSPVLSPYAVEFSLPYLQYHATYISMNEYLQRITEYADECFTSGVQVNHNHIRQGLVFLDDRVILKLAPVALYSLSILD